LDPELAAHPQKPRQWALARSGLGRQRLRQLALIVAPAGVAEHLVSRNGFLPQLVRESDQLLDMFRQCLHEHHFGVPQRLGPVLDRQQERCPGVARRQVPGRPVYSQPHELHLFQFRVCPGDERSGISEPAGAHHVHCRYHLAHKVLVVFGYAHQFLSGLYHMLLLFG
jgi:hypothetical protein